MTRIYDKEVNRIAEFNLLHDIINPPKCTKTSNYHYSPILHGCMNTRKGIRPGPQAQLRPLLGSGLPTQRLSGGARTVPLGT